MNMKYLEVKVGNDSQEKIRCEFKHLSPKLFEFEVFECPSPGIVGNMITVHKLNSSNLLSSELQVYGMIIVQSNIFTPFWNLSYKTQF